MKGPNPKLIGATDAAAIMGASAYKSAFDVWARIVEGVEAPRGEAAAWGLRLESVVADAFSERIGKPLLKADPIEHPRGRVWQRVSPDYLIAYDRPEDARQLAEVKTTGAHNAHRWGEEGTDQIPDEYLIQVQTQLEALDYSIAHVPVLIGGQELRCYRVARDVEFGEMIVAACEKFWRDHIVTQRAPEPMASTAGLTEYLRNRYPKDANPVRDATAEEAAILEELARLRGRRDAAEGEVEALEAKLKLAIGDAAGLRCGLGEVTYRAPKDSIKTDWQAVAAELRTMLELRGEPVEPVVTKHTQTKPNSRRFVVKLKGAA